MTSIAITQATEWPLPYRGRVGVLCLIATEAALFTIFVVAYVFYAGKSLVGPYPSDVLELPLWSTFCLLSSSVTVTIAERALMQSRLSTFRLSLGLTILLAAEFLHQTALEWHRLIVNHHLTISTNLFGTTFYSLVGLHASHVIAGASLLLIVFIAGLQGNTMVKHARRFELLSWYWHFVDAVWVVVFMVVYVNR